MRRINLTVVVVFLVAVFALAETPAQAWNGIEPFSVDPIENAPSSTIPALVKQTIAIDTFENELSTIAPQSSTQAIAWYDGLIQYSTILNCVSIIQGFPYTENGMGAYVGFTADPEAAAPGINQTYYVHVIVAGLGNSCAGQRAFIDIQLPASTTLAITPSTPVYCFAGGNPLNPPSDCPQTLPASPFNPGAYAIYSTDATNNYTWPVPQGAFWEFQIPVKSIAALTGNLFRANVWAMDGNDNPWLRPEIGVFVFSNTPTVIYPSPSTLTTQLPDLSFQYKSQAYIYTFGQLGTAYFDLGTSNGNYSLKTDAIPITTAGNAWYVWDDWNDPPFSLQPNTTYHWRARFVSSGSQTYLGPNQSFTTNSSGQVTVGNGNAASCSTSALNTALNTPGLETLLFDCGPTPVTIAMSAQKIILADLEIDGNNLITINAPANSRHFDVSNGSTLALNNLVLSGGNESVGCGGSVRVAGSSTLVTNRVSFINNHALSDGGALCVVSGSQASINSSLFKGNSAGGLGGAIANFGALGLIWTDVSNNSSVGNGGGIYSDAATAGSYLEFLFGLLAENNASGSSAKGGGVFASGPAYFTTVTVANNRASDGAGIYKFHDFITMDFVTLANNTASSGIGGLSIGGTGIAYISGSILAQNSPSNCGSAQPIFSNGYNLENTNQCAFNAASDKKNMDPMLDRLRFNGGKTRTMFVKPGSPAIDAGNPAGCGQFDQRGFFGASSDITLREADGNGDGIARCDIGAFEKLPTDMLIRDTFLPMIKR